MRRLVDQVTRVACEPEIGLPLVSLLLA